MTSQCSSIMIFVLALLLTRLKDARGTLFQIKTVSLIKNTSCTLYETLIPDHHGEVTCATVCSQIENCYYFNYNKHKKCLTCVSRWGSLWHLRKTELSPMEYNETVFIQSCSPYRGLHFYDVALTWSAARSACQALGNDLLTLENIAKREYVKNLMTELTSQGKVPAHCNGLNGYAYWTSAYKYGGNPAWTWGNEQSIMSSLWVPGQPNGDGSCTLSNKVYNYNIHDGPCERLYCYICDEKCWDFT